MGHDHQQGISPRALAAMAGLVVFALVAVIVARLAGVDPDQSPGGTPVGSRTLVFQEQADGTLLVQDGETGALVEEIGPGEGNFVRGILRGVRRTRETRSVPLDAPLLLQRYDDGRLVLYDPATGDDMVLRAFGASNAAAFARFLATAP